MVDYPTSLGTSDAEHIRLLGHDLAGELMGKVSFGELAFWLVARRRPTAHEVRVFEAVLVSLADHGFTPTAIAARLTYYSAPDSLQGAVAAGLLGGGSRFLGVTEDTGSYLHGILAELPAGHEAWTDAEWDEVARAALERAKAEGAHIPGLGHPVHKNGDPRTPVIMRIAREEGHLRAAPQAVRGDRAHPAGRARQEAAAQRSRCRRRRARRPRAPRRVAARVRAACPHRGARRPDRRGTDHADRTGGLLLGRPQRRLRASERRRSERGTPSDN
ncbi:MAG: citryl-CoA lyase [Galbitalea sp.]